jgi:ABC-type cobalamin/Fe3+-siderophores transport system ATPase subunit
VITFFAKTNSRNKEVKFGIRRADRGRHMYVIGKTGMGKSTLLENLAIQDIQNGEGLAFIDPHGSTAERLLSYVPKERIRDVIYFAPFDLEYPVAFNVMEDVGSTPGARAWSTSCPIRCLLCWSIRTQRFST